MGRRIQRSTNVARSLCVIPLFWLGVGLAGTEPAGSEASAGKASSDPKGQAHGPAVAEPPPKQKPPAADRSVYDPGSDENIRRFGENRLQPVDNARFILFRGGRYVEAPYQVTRKGMGVYVNEHLVEFEKWPGPYYLADDPPIPEEVTRESSFNAPDGGNGPARQWSMSKYCYLHSHFPPKEADEKYIEALHLLPCVQRVIVERRPRSGEIIVQIFTFHGELELIHLEPDRDLRPPPPERLIRRLDEAADRWHEHVGIAEGFSWSGTIFFSPGETNWYYVPEIVELLKSERSAIEKSKRLTPFFGGSWNLSIAPLALCRRLVS